MVEKTFFISFEGIDGCGKDTQLHKLVEAIKEDDGYPFGNKYSHIWVTREPTQITESGLKISNLIRERDVSKEEATELYVADRLEHTKIIKDVLKHSHVLTSRYDLSTLAYQMTQGMDFEDLYEMHKFDEDNGCILPDLTLVFDLDVDIAFERMGNRDSATECFEKKDFQEKLKGNLNYAIDELRKKGRKILVVDASKPIDDVTLEMIKQIDKNLKK